MQNLVEGTFYVQNPDTLEFRIWQVEEDCLLKEPVILTKDTVDTILMMPYEKLSEVLREVLFNNVDDKRHQNYEQYLIDVSRVFHNMGISMEHWPSMESLEYIKDVTLNSKTVSAKTEAIVHTINNILSSK